MSEGFQRGLWGNGSHGDPGPDAMLPPAAAEALLDGQPWLVPAELRPLTDAVAALAGPPSEAELRGEPRARAAYRARGMSHTLPLEIAPAGPRRRAPRARHRAAPTRPPGHRAAGGRLGVVSGITAVVIAVAGGVAFATGAFPSHVKSPSPAVARSSTGSSAATGGNAGLNGTAAPAPSVTTSSASASATGIAADGPRQWCEAWLKNPWRPGVKDWDEADFDKLSAKAHGPQYVLWYCVKLLPGDYFGAKPGTGYPARYSGGFWWVPSGRNPGPPGPGPNGQGGSANPNPAKPLPGAAGTSGIVRHPSLVTNRIGRGPGSQTGGA